MTRRPLRNKLPPQRPGFFPDGEAPPGCRAARLVAPETGRRRTLRHRLARTGSAPHQPRLASRPKPSPREFRTCSREPARSSSTMPPHVTTPHKRAPLPGGMGHVRTKCEMVSRTFFASPERERSSRAERDRVRDCPSQRSLPSLLPCGRGPHPCPSPVRERGWRRPVFPRSLPTKSLRPTRRWRLRRSALRIAVRSLKARSRSSLTRT